MNHVELINSQLKSAMLSSDKLRTETLRSLRARIIEFEKNGSGKLLDEESFLKIVSLEVKRRKDSIDQFTQAGRTEFAEKESQELSILMEFMPEQLTANDVEQIIRKIALEVGATTANDFGKLMGAVMKELKGKADGATIQQSVNRVLNK